MLSQAIAAAGDGPPDYLRSFWLTAGLSAATTLFVVAVHYHFKRYEQQSNMALGLEAA